MFDDLCLILASIVGAVGAVAAFSAHLAVPAVIGALVYTAAIFCMGYRSNRE